MKRMLLLVLLAISFVAVNAQTGLFEIRYGDTRSESIGLLESKGFVLSEAGETFVILVNESNPAVAYAELRFDADDLLIGWSIAYNDLEDEYIEDLVIEALESLHGDDWDYDYDLEYYLFVLDENHYVEAGWSYFDSYYWVDYYTGSASGY